MTDVNNISLNHELKKFTRLCKQAGYPLPMFSKLIDEHWHYKIEQGDLKLPIHDTSIKTNACEEIHWIESYEKKYGRLSNLWFTQLDGKLNLEVYEKYLCSGKVFSSYNCAGRCDLF